MTIEIYSLGDIKEELAILPKYFERFDTMGGINNRHLPKLEQKLGQRMNKTAVSVSSCTNGIYLALKQLKLDNDPVFIPPITFFGLGGAILKAGGIPVFTPVDKFGLMDSQKVLEYLDYNWPKQAKAVIPCHINNRYVTVDPLQDKIHIIEDAAPSMGTENTNGQCIITASKNTSVISFSYGKPLTAGEGGMIFSDTLTGNWIKGQRYCGLDNLDGQYGYGKFKVEQSDLKLPYHGLGAMLIWEKLKKFNQQLERRREIARFYNDQFGHLQNFDFYTKGNHITHVILLKDFYQRQQVKSILEQQGIKSYYSHQPMFYFDAFKSFTGIPGYIETANDYFNCVLHIPCRYDLSDSEVVMIAETTKKALS